MELLDSWVTNLGKLQSIGDRAEDTHKILLMVTEALKESRQALMSFYHDLRIGRVLRSGSFGVALQNHAKTECLYLSIRA